MSSDNAVKVEGLSKGYHIYDKPRDRLLQMLCRGRKQYYREFWALKNVSFEIKRGETVGIIGRNGSGKSTLLQLICGTVNPTSGNIHINGRVAALLELGSGFNPEFTGRENVYLNAAVLGLRKEEIDARYDEIVAFADIDDFIEQPVKTYSSGMLVRLAFAVIAHVDADILVIDEALAVGDAFFTQKCMRFLRAFMRSGTVLFVSHDTGSIKSLCNKAIWLEKGSVIQEGSPKEVCELYLQAFYEVEQGKSSTTKLKVIHDHGKERQLRDQRQELVNSSTLRNDLRVFIFDPESASFGKGGAQITNVEFINEEGNVLAWIVGGEKVILRVYVAIYEELMAPIVGFFVKDRLGQNLFGDNTYLSYKDIKIFCDQGSEIVAEFMFYMPILPVGEYSVNVAIANGTQEHHVQHHWIHDAILFRSESSSVATGLVGIPMQRITLNLV